MVFRPTCFDLSLARFRRFLAGCVPLADVLLWNFRFCSVPVCVAYLALFCGPPVLCQARLALPGELWPTGWPAGRPTPVFGQLCSWKLHKFWPTCLQWADLGLPIVSSSISTLGRAGWRAGGPADACVICMILGGSPWSILRSKLVLRQVPRRGATKLPLYAVDSCLTACVSRVWQTQRAPCLVFISDPASVEDLVLEFSTLFIV